MHIQSIELYQNDLNLLQQTVEQIIKDFATHGLEIKFSNLNKSPYEELMSQLNPQIAHLLANDQERLFALLYSIDLPEKKLKEALKKSDNNLVLELSELILKRELQKVVLRNFFSNHSKNSSNQDKPQV